ncbi:MAG: LysR family transcriptional regulator [Myxococcota bacterium]
MVIDDPFDGLLPFVEVAERRSFRAAAEALGVTPASVSRSIKRLEVELGVTLLHRTTRQVRLSQEGTIYLAACREALAQVRAGREQIGMSRREARGQVRISASFVFGAFMVRCRGHRFSVLRMWRST